MEWNITRDLVFVANLCGDTLLWMASDSNPGGLLQERLLACGRLPPLVSPPLASPTWSCKSLIRFIVSANNCFITHPSLLNLTFDRSICSVKHHHVVRIQQLTAFLLIHWKARKCADVYAPPRTSTEIRVRQEPSNKKKIESWKKGRCWGRREEDEEYRQQWEEEMLWFHFPLTDLDLILKPNQLKRNTLLSTPSADGGYREVTHTHTLWLEREPETTDSL